jgi:hypothetical protein
MSAEDGGDRSTPFALRSSDAHLPLPPASSATLDAQNRYAAERELRAATTWKDVPEDERARREASLKDQILSDDVAVQP